MRTTLDLDDDVLMLARDRAQQERTSIGKMISMLLRERFARTALDESLREPDADGFIHQNGVAMFPRRSRVVKREVIQHLLDQEGV